jgi:CheY-like chemotaxis protein
MLRPDRKIFRNNEAAPSSWNWGYRSTTGSLSPASAGLLFLRYVMTSCDEARTEPSAATDGTPRRVLVVEDEFHMARYVDEILHRMGMQVIGPVGTLRQAMMLAEMEPIDAALLDVQLQPDVRLPHSDRVYPVAELLRRRRIPFSFVTAYEDHAIDRFPADPVLRKPFREDQLQSMVRRLLCDDPGAPQL